jgi:hypothetical protein
MVEIPTGLPEDPMRPDDRRVACSRRKRLSPVRVFKETDGRDAACCAGSCKALVCISSRLLACMVEAGRCACVHAMSLHDHRARGEGVPEYT